MAVVCTIGAAAAALAVLAVLAPEPVGSARTMYGLPAVVAGGTLGGALWWALVERPGKPTVVRALLAGFLVGVLAHPLLWALHFLVGPLYAPVEPLGPTVLAGTILSVSVLSILFFGWVTAPVAVGCGLLVLLLRRRAGG